MQEAFEEARSIRRKAKREGKTAESEDHTKVSEKVRIERELEELTVSTRIAQEEAEEFNAKVKEIKRNLRNILYNSELGLEEKARKVANLKSQQENCEFIAKQAVAKWARLTNKKSALERELENIEKSE